MKPSERLKTGSGCGLDLDGGDGSDAFGRGCFFMGLYRNPMYVQ